MSQLISSSALRTIVRPFFVAAFVCAAMAGSAAADEFPAFDGKATVVWKTTVVMGAAWRNASPQGSLIGAGAAQTGEFPGATGSVGVNDDSDLNFGKYDLISAPVTLLTTARIQFKTSGIYLSARSWYDMGLNAKSVPHGSAVNMFKPKAQLDDTNFQGAAKFQGIDVYDAIYYRNDNIGRLKVQSRIGRLALTWGQGLLYPGINAFNPVDLGWSIMPGARIVNGASLPVARLYENVMLPRGWNIGGFVNFEFRNSVMPGCGTWYMMVDNGLSPGCNVATAAGLPDTIANLVPTKSYWEGKLYKGGYFPDGGASRPEATGKPSNWSGWGFTLHKFIEPIKTEFGGYYVKYTNPTPTVGTLPSPNGADFAVNTYFVPGVRAFAVSASTGVKNVSLSGQLTQTFGLPAQRSFPSLLSGALGGFGAPGTKRGPYVNQADYYGKEYPGHVKVDVTQGQIGAIGQYGRLLHLQNAIFIAETDLQWAPNMPGLDKERLGRFGNFGVADLAGPDPQCTSTPDPKTGATNMCEPSGFFTPFAMGYKLRTFATLPATKRGNVFTPTFFFGQDVKGWSTDQSIVGTRVNYGGTLRVDIRARYFFEAGASAYKHNAKWDPLRDRGLYTATFGINLQ